MAGDREAPTEVFNCKILKVNSIQNSQAGVGISYTGDTTWVDGTDFATGTSTGTKIGTGVTQKIGFWNVTPIIQPKDTLQGAITDNSGGSGTDIPAVSGTGDDADINNAHFAIFGLLNQIRDALVDSGIMKGGA